MHGLVSGKAYPGCVVFELTNTVSDAPSLGWAVVDMKTELEDCERTDMWILTKCGLFSAVCARAGGGGYGQPVDPDRIMVWGRLREHIEALKGRFPELLGCSEVVATGGTDYAFRLFVAKAVWAQVLGALAEETAYDNFKSAVAREQGRAGAAYQGALHDVWAVMHRLQRL